VWKTLDTLCCFRTSISGIIYLFFNLIFVRTISGTRCPSHSHGRYKTTKNRENSTKCRRVSLQCLSKSLKEKYSQSTILGFVPRIMPIYRLQVGFRLWIRSSIPTWLKSARNPAWIESPIPRVGPPGAVLLFLFGAHNPP